MMRIVLLAICVLLLWLAARDVWAQQQPFCDDSERFAAVLDERYGERVVAFGVIERGNTALMRIWATPGGETWSITVTAANAAAPSGFVTCLVGSGTAYRPARIERGDQS